MSFIDTCTEMLVSAIKNGSVYKQYCAALEAVNQIPGLKVKVDELRSLNYRVQNQEEGNNLYEAIDDLERSTEELCKIPEVNQFLEAELSLCRQLQGITTAIHRESNWIYRICHRTRRLTWENKSENRKHHPL